MQEINTAAAVSNAGSIHTPSIADTHETHAKYPGLLVHDISEAQHFDATPNATGSCPAKFLSIPHSATYREGGLKPGVIYRVKEVGSDFLAVNEVMSNQVFKLSGLKCPPMHLVNNCHQMQDSATYDPEKLYVASEYNPLLKIVDIGDFPFTEQGKQVILADSPHLKDKTGKHPYYQEIANHQKAVAEQKSIEEQHGAWWAINAPKKELHGLPVQGPMTLEEYNVAIGPYRQADASRFKALEALNRMLPATLRYEQTKHHIGSRNGGNWDPKNCFMHNTCVGTDEEGKLFVTTVDFGAFGPVAFQGMNKSDPAAHMTAFMQRPAALRYIDFPLPSVREPGAKNKPFLDFNGPSPKSINALSDMPYDSQLITSVGELTREETQYYDVRLRSNAEMAPAFDMAYRFHLASHDAFEKVIDQHWITPPPDFLAGKNPILPEKDDPPATAPIQLELTKEMLIASVHRHNAAFVERIGADRLVDWERQHPAIAAQCRADMNEALKELGFKDHYITPLASYVEWYALQMA